MPQASFHLLHKPIGPSSFEVLSAFRRQRKIDRRACHGGTLDPFASGLLIALVEPATKLFDYLHDIPKVYRATVRWGVETDNGDPLGTPCFSGDPTSLNPAKLDAVLCGFIGWHEQTPPATSAKRIGGVRAYERVRRGETVEMPASRVYLHEAKWLEHQLPGQSILRMSVRGGFYVRALARDLGRLLGCGAHVSQLHREAIGPWSDPGAGGVTDVSGDGILPWMRIRLLNDSEVGELRRMEVIDLDEVINGNWELPKDFPHTPSIIRGMHQGKLRFLLQETTGGLQATTMLRGGI